MKTTKQNESIGEKISLADLATLAGVTPRWINALVKQEHLPRPDAEGFPARTTIAALLRRRDASNIQREKFLKLAAERRQEERKDRIAEKVEERTYMELTEVSSILQMGIRAIELVPSKMQSEFNFTQAQTDRLVQLLDEARREWVKQMETQPSEAAI